jgi:endogenous inhibitor of DNA gyrase (YacG/DUF329 family)
MAACPQCQGPVGARAGTPSFPFCCERCRLLDLGAWLDERYRIPVLQPDADEPGTDEDAAPPRD